MNVGKIISILGLIVGLVCLFGLGSCEEEWEDYPALETSYFPIAEGDYAIYQVDSSVWNEYDGTYYTHSFQLMEVTGTADTDNEGNTYNRIERWVREDSTASWQFEGVWTALINEQRAERVEDNQRFIKLAFPIEENQTWNTLVHIRRDTLVPLPGSSIDMYKGWEESAYLTVDASGLVNNTIYDSTVTVLHVDYQNLIERRYLLETYAKGVGLVYKEARILDTQCVNRCECYDPDNCTTDLCCTLVDWPFKADPSYGFIDKGFILTQTLLEYHRN